MIIIPRVVNKKVKQQSKQNEVAYCRRCQKTKSINSFYIATNPMIDKNGYMSVCKDCCNEIYYEYFNIHNNLEVALQLTCESLDVCFNKEALKQTKSQVESYLEKGKKSDAIFGYYKSKLGSTGKNNANIESFRYKDSDIIVQDDIQESYINKDVDISNDVIKYWGKNLEIWEYEFLSEEKYKIETSFECPDYGMEMLMRDICFINLDIERIRQNGEKGDVSKLIETRSKLMNDAKMKPIQATGAEANDQVSFGTLIKKWENESPVPQKLDDEMKKYIDTYMVGHLAKMQGLNCDAVDIYEKSLKDYTIDFEELDNKDDE